MSLFIWSRVPETTLAGSLGTPVDPGRADFSLISLKNSTNCLHENPNSCQRRGGGGTREPELVSKAGGGGRDNSGPYLLRRFNTPKPTLRAEPPLVFFFKNRASKRKALLAGWPKPCQAGQLFLI